MALDKGDADCSTGLSKRIFDNWTGDARSGYSNPLAPAQTDSIKALAWGVARAVVDEIAANAEVSVDVKTTDSDLQRDPVAPNAGTLGPSSDKTLAGTVS